MAHLRLPCVTDGYERCIRRRKDLSDARERFFSRHLAQLRPGRRTEAAQLSTPDPVNDQLQPKGGPMLARRRLLPASAVLAHEYSVRARCGPRRRTTIWGTWTPIRSPLIVESGLEGAF